MAIKFSAKDQPAASAAATKPAKAAADVKKPAVTPKPADGSTEGATDLFLSSAESPKGKTRKKR
jgi:hypothetical protein